MLCMRSIVTRYWASLAQSVLNGGGPVWIEIHFHILRLLLLLFRYPLQHLRYPFKRRRNPV